MPKKNEPVRDVTLNVLNVKETANGGVITDMVVPQETKVETVIPNVIPSEPIERPELTGEAKQVHEFVKQTMVIKDRTNDGTKRTQRGKEIVVHETKDAELGFIPAGAPTKLKM